MNHDKISGTSSTVDIPTKESKYLPGIQNNVGSNQQSASVMLHPYTCEICGKHYYSSSGFRRHRKSYKENGMNCKDEQDKKFILHKEKKQKTYNCLECGKSLAKQWSFDQHMKLHIAVDPYPCTKCPTRFRKELDLKLHILSHSGLDSLVPTGPKIPASEPEKPFPCDQCQKEFVGRENLDKHLELHARAPEEQSFQCEFCGKFFVLRSGLNTHKERRHSEVNPFSCTICGKQYASVRFLTEHMRVHNENDGGEFKCEYCSETFKIKLNYTTHLRSHKGKLLKCLECGTSVWNKVDLVKHMEMHTRKEQIETEIEMELSAQG